MIMNHRSTSADINLETSTIRNTHIPLFVYMHVLLTVDAVLQEYLGIT